MSPLRIQMALLALFAFPGPASGRPAPAVHREADTPAEAGPTLTIRGSTRLELERMDRTAEGVLVTVRLLDDDLGAPVPDRDVTVSVRKGPLEILRRSGHTNAEGRAQLLIPHRSGRYQLALSFSGDALYATAPREVSEVDLSKGAVSLSLEAPSRIPLGTGRALLRILARHGNPLAALPVRLRVRRGARVLFQDRGVTDPSGTWEAVLPVGRLGPPGPLALEAFSEATRRFNRGHVRQRIYLVSRPTVSLELSAHRVQVGGRVRAAGRVRDARGPLPDAQVNLVARIGRLATARTDGAGRFAVDLPSRLLEPGIVHVRAQFVPAAPWYLPAASIPVRLQVNPPAPIPTSYFLLPAAVTALLLLSLWAARARPWRRLARARRRDWPDRPEARRPGVELGRRTGRHRRSGAHRLRISGSVLDLHDDSPVTTATVYLRPQGPDGDGTARSQMTGDDGTFGFDEIPTGPYRLVAAAPGWIPQSLDLRIPHRGELEGITIRLLSVRQEVMRIYTEVVSPLLPGSDRVYLWTPAEVAAHLRRTAPSTGVAVEPLADLAAKARYGAAPPAEQTLRAAESLAAQARAKLASGAETPEASAAERGNGGP